MEKSKFKKILFKVAFCAMACDGDIDEREIKELRYMNQNTTYFADIDLSGELNELVNDFKNKGARVIEELFSELREADLNTIQELLILEVALRVIYADKRIDENEVKFINFLRSKLKLHDETIIDRFGQVDILYTNEYARNLKSEKEYTENLTIPSIEDLSKIDLTNVVKKK